MNANPALVDPAAFEKPATAPPRVLRKGVSNRPTVRGKFLYSGSEKLWIRGVTYGTFRPRPGGEPFPPPETVDRDFATMRSHGINSVRTYTVPPRWLLDMAAAHGLRVMAGLPWEQHVAFLDDPGRAREVVARTRAAVRRCAHHPAVLCFVIGNEIPASIVRWHGRRRVERFLRRLYRAAKQEDPDALVTYVNFPTTEYLQLPFLDLVCFNVYLEQRERLEAYLARLQNIAGERPLLLAEMGLDSRGNGEEAQGKSLEWQIRSAFAGGCAGAFVFAWTDEWHRGGYDIEDWDFGLTTRERQPKPALWTVRDAFAQVPFPAETDWPLVSVVVCSYNGAHTIRDTLEGLARLDYPRYEVIVVDDGSRDGTAHIAAQYRVRLIRTENRGLSNARNTGWKAARGEIVAYIDDDAYPDPHWLQYLSWTFLHTEHTGVGGPNLAPPGDGPVAECVANAPGGPAHVLTGDREAEHIPGCNMAFRKAALAAVGGFDPRYRTAGDDVDLCWRLQKDGGTLGFHAAALVWHHRRNSLRAYWRQQVGYGRAEALLEAKWPERYNVSGHVRWSGRLYGRGPTPALPAGRWRVYHGRWNSAPFQSLYAPAPSVLLGLPLMPEWYLVIALLGVLCGLGALWHPLLLLLPLLLAALGAPLAQAALAGAGAVFTNSNSAAGPLERVQLHVLTTILHLAQPLARLIGRMRHGLSPWRRRGAAEFALPGRYTLWSEAWRSPQDWLQTMWDRLRAHGAVASAGGVYDAWDLTVRGGLFGSLRITLAVEEHGAGCQVIRLRSRPSVPLMAALLAAVFAGLGSAATVGGAPAAGLVLWAITTAIIIGAMLACATAAGTWRRTLRELARDLQPTT